MSVKSLAFRGSSSLGECCDILSVDSHLGSAWTEGRTGGSDRVFSTGSRYVAVEDKLNNTTLLDSKQAGVKTTTSEGLAAAIHRYCPFDACLQDTAPNCISKAIEQMVLRIATARDHNDKREKGITAECFRLCSTAKYHGLPLKPHSSDRNDGFLPLRNLK